MLLITVDMVLWVMDNVELVMNVVRHSVGVVWVQPIVRIRMLILVVMVSSVIVFVPILHCAVLHSVIVVLLRRIVIPKNKNKN